MDDFWAKNLGIKSQDEPSEYEMLEEAQETEHIAEEYAAQPVIEEASDEDLRAISEESALDLDVRESNVVYNARLRLEQARLYEMLINHDLFSGVDADPNAIHNVQNELKHYIVARLEILLGLRRPVLKRDVSNEDHFNNVEKNFLKQLAEVGTKGASKKVVSSDPIPEVKEYTGGLNPIGYKARPKTLNQLERKAVSRPIQNIEVKNEVKKVNNTPPKKDPNKIKSGGAIKRNLTKTEIEELAKKEVEFSKKNKPFHKMSAKEKAEKVKKIKEEDKNNVKKRPATAAPMMTDISQLQAKYMTEQQMRSSTNSHQKIQFNQMLAGVLARKKQEE